MLDALDTCGTCTCMEMWCACDYFEEAVAHMYMYIYVCMCVCMYVCMYVRIYVCMHVCMYVCMYVCMHVCMCMYAYMYICMYVFSSGGVILAVIEGVGIAINRAVAEQYKPGKRVSMGPRCHVCVGGVFLEKCLVLDAVMVKMTPCVCVCVCVCGLCWIPRWCVCVCVCVCVALLLFVNTCCYDVCISACVVHVHMYVYLAKLTRLG